MKSDRASLYWKFDPPRPPTAGGWALAASILGSISWLTALAEILVLLAGWPFTVLLLYVAWLVVPLHTLTLLVVVRACLEIPQSEGVPNGVPYALMAAGIGLCPYTMLSLGVW